MHDVFNSSTPINISNLFSSSAKIHCYYKYGMFSIPKSIQSLSKNIFKKKMNKELLHVLSLEDTYVSVETVMTKIFKT